jgi:hypothetical protein
VWDSTLIAKTLRTMPYNYTYPLPVPAVEDSLRETIYDPYIRRIMWEGLLTDGTWQNEIASWLTCPSASMASGNRQTVMGSAGAPGTEFDNESICPFHWASQIHPLNCDYVWPKELDTPEYLGSIDNTNTHEHHCGGDDENEAHHTEADSVGRPPYPQPHYLELDTPKYAGKIAEGRVVEKTLAMGGIRLAAILNWLFVNPEALAERGLWTERLQMGA